MAVPIVLVEGDGVGPELCGVATRVVDAAGLDVEWVQRSAGEEAWRRTGEVMPADTLDAIREVGACLKGPFWTPSGGTRRSPNHSLRIALDLYACVRRFRDATGGADVTLVRENVEDLYGAVEWWATADVAQALKVATRKGCERIARFACEEAIAAGHRTVTAVHKANNLKLTEGLFLETVQSVGKGLDVVVTDLLADTAASTAVLEPESLAVVVANNTFGDLLSNVLAARLTGLGAVASLNVGVEICVAEASHGDARELVGSGRANPVGLVLAAAALLRRKGLAEPAIRLEAAVERVVASGCATPDRGGTATTGEVEAELVAALQGPCR